MSEGLQLVGEVDQPVDWNAMIDQQFLPQDLQKLLKSRRRLGTEHIAPHQGRPDPHRHGRRRFAALEILCRIGIIPRATMIPPTEMVAALWQILRSGQANSDIAFTLFNTFAAIALSIVLGFWLGAALHALPRLRRAFEPLLSAYYAVPIFIFYPLLIVAFGVGRTALIVMGAMFGVVAMIVNTMIGPRSRAVGHRADRDGHAARARCAGSLLLRLPAASPHLVTGIKLAVAYSVIGIVAGEFILATAGIGKRIAFGYQDFDNRTMYGMLLLLLIVVMVVNGALSHWEKRLASPLRPAMKPHGYDALLLAAGFLVCWQILYWLVGADVVSSPSDTLLRAVALLQDAEFLARRGEHRHRVRLRLRHRYCRRHAARTALGLNRFAGDVADPILGTVYSIPKITLYPIILLIFGLSLTAKVAFGVIHGIFPGGHFHHECGSQRRAGAPPHRKGAAAVAACHDRDGAGARPQFRKFSPVSASASP